jgi:hypothetical protein
MDVQFSPEQQAQIDRWTIETGRGPAELVKDAMAAYFEELAQTRRILDSRYDDLKNGHTKPISAGDVENYFQAKSAARRSHPGA